MTDGEIKVSGISHQLIIERDEQGVPRITANSRLDLAYALGWLHAQERFFQMDLLRRRSSARLSQLFGDIALAADKKVVIHQFMQKAERAYLNLESHHKILLQRYTQGVNSGLEQLTTYPFEYWLLGQAPQRWQPRDTFLVLYSMYLNLQDSNGLSEHLQSRLAERVPEKLLSFLTPQFTRWDAPLDNSHIEDIELAAPLTKQGALRWRLRDLAEPIQSGNEQHIPGSNNFALAASRTASGRAILAGDMHLGLSIPNIWYRAEMHYQASDGDWRHLLGVTLPGTPLLIAGSNTKIAWTFTNSQVDTTDLVKLEVNASNDRYRLGQQWIEFDIVRNKLLSNDGRLHSVEFASTPWGPVVKHDSEVYALRWIAHDTAAANMELLNLETIDSLDAALALAPTVGIPTQNLLVADNRGNIGWTIIGPVPKRKLRTGKAAVTVTKQEDIWTGIQDKHDYPKIINPEDGQLWTANNRQLGGKWLGFLGNGGFAFAARSRQIRDDLKQLKGATEIDLLKIQLDDKAQFLSEWRSILLNHWPANPKYDHLKQLVEQWDAAATTSDKGYPLVRKYRYFIAEAILRPIYSVAAGLPEEKYRPYQFSRQYEAPLRALIERQPKDWLSEGATNWRDLLELLTERFLKLQLRAYPDGQYPSWGEINKAQIRHPLSQALPLLNQFLDMPEHSLPGDRDMPRVQAPKFGASQRMVISPGHEEQAIFHMPGGQSGHPLSDYYDTDHTNWVSGNASPLRVKEIKYRLLLKPM